MKSYRIFVEKYPEFRVEAESLLRDLNANLNLSLDGLRLLNVYDLFGFSDELLEKSRYRVFGEVVTDAVTDSCDLGGNSFLRTYGTKEEFLDLDAQLAGGTVPIDLMRTSLGLSATICAAGLDAQVAYGIPKFRRIPLCGGEAAYALSIVQQLCGHIGRRVEYVIDGEVLTVDCLMCAVCNGRAYGGGFMAGPEAQPDDGWLDVFIVRKVSRRVIAKLLMLYKNGQHFKNGQLTEAAKPYFIYRRAKSVSLRAADGRGPIIATVDGECAPCKQVSVQVQPLAGRVLLPLPAYQRFTAKKAAVK